MMMNQYRSCHTMFEKNGGMDSVGILDPVDDLKSLSVKLEHSFERLYEEIKIAGERKGVDFNLEKVLTSIDTKLNSILEATQNIKITTVQPGTSNVHNTESYESDDFFIPSTFEGETFTGKVTKSSKVSEDSTDSAAEALRRLRNKKPKSKK